MTTNGYSNEDFVANLLPPTTSYFTQYVVCSSLCAKPAHTITHRQRDAQTDRQKTDRHTDRHTDTHRHTQTLGLHYNPPPTQGVSINHDNKMR